LVVAMTLGLSVPATAAAATITLVDCPSSGVQTLELWQAIVDANDEATHPGQDVIQLAPGCDYPMVGPYPGTDYALPAITSAIEIQGRGARLTTGPRGSTENPMGLIDVAAGGGLVIANLTLFNDFGIQGGATYVRNAGATTLSHVTIHGFNTVAGPALMNLAGADLTFLDSTLSDYLYNSGSDTVGSAVDNGGNFYAIGSDFVDNNIEPLRALLPSIRYSRSIVNRGHMELTDSVVKATDSHTNPFGADSFARGILSTGSLVLRGSEISGHSYPVNGAGIRSTGTLDVEASTISDNHSMGTGVHGGGIDNVGTATIENSVLRGNTAEDGGDLYNLFLATLSFSDAGDIANNPFAVLQSGGSILFSCSGTIGDLGANLAETGSCPGVSGDPKLVNRSTPTGIRGTVYGLGPGSAALDAGGSTCPATDQRGLPRPAGGACDIGPYENQPPTAPSLLHIGLGANPSNTGNLELDWTASTDADIDTITYRLYGRDADDAGETLLATGTGRSATLTGLAEGTYGFRVEADDGLATSGSASLSPVVVDRSGPSAPTGATDRAPDFTATDGTGWYRDAVDVTFSGSTDPLLLDGSQPSGVASITATQTFSTSGEHLATGHATDGAGNASLDGSLTVHVDADAPTVTFDSCPASVLLGKAVSLGWAASDGESGLATAASGHVTVDTQTIGTRTLTAGATDNVGHTGSATCVVQVIFDFKGFNNPLANVPTFNKASAGGIVSVSFSLGGAQGLAIFASGYPASAPISCGSSVALTTGTPTAAASPALVYGGGRYTYSWKTDKAWAGTCRQLIVKLTDGTYHWANFMFK
ncbi:MAG TPA: PxKF domain-containing protein, partial [Candidatus Acidoferrales bacterium]|nr:PxKF domain-containing protein [Candidatus Acidoferrales bacterium]